MKKITLITLSIILSFLSFTVSSDVTIKDETIGRDDIFEMSEKYVLDVNKKLDLDISSKQTKELTNIMVDYVYEFKDTKSIIEANELENKFNDKIKNVLSDEQWKKINKEFN